MKTYEHYISGAAIGPHSGAYLNTDNPYTGDIWAQEGMFAGNSSTPGRILAYNLYSNASNYERGGFDWNTSNVLTIGTEAAGTGVLRELHLVTEGNSGVTPNTLKLRNRYGYLELYNDDANGINIGVNGPYYLQISSGNWNYRCKNDFNHIFQKPCNYLGVSFKFCLD